MSFEITHLKTELEKLFKKQIASNLASQGRLKAFHSADLQNAAAATPKERDSSFKMALNRIASLAQQSIKQSTADKMQMNDSLDVMRREFVK